MGVVSVVAASYAFHPGPRGRMGDWTSRSTGGDVPTQRTLSAECNSHPGLAVPTYGTCPWGRGAIGTHAHSPAASIGLSQITLVVMLSRTSRVPTTSRGSD